jgi:hypothetical protein
MIPKDHYECAVRYHELSVNISSKEKNLNILYNIPYNPETNFIEMIFCPVKKYIRSNNIQPILTIFIKLKKIH